MCHPLKFCFVVFVCICLDGADAQHDNDNDTLQPIETSIGKKD